MRWSAVALLAAAGVVRAEPPKPVDFAHDVVPVLKARCAECHTNGKYKGSFSLDTREAVLKTKAVVPGKSGESKLVKRITSDDPEERMPAKGEPLSAKEVALLRAWIDQGLPWQEGFSFKASGYVAPLKPRRPPMPPTSVGHSHPIDRLLDEYFAKTRTERPAPLDDTAFARRIYLDVIGQLPAPSELQSFLDDPAADKRARLARRLLDDNRAFVDH